MQKRTKLTGATVSMAAKSLENGNPLGINPATMFDNLVKCDWCGMHAIQDQATVINVYDNRRKDGKPMTTCPACKTQIENTFRACPHAKVYNQGQTNKEEP